MGIPSVKPYAHLFFDLDHTLWDFRGNSRETLRELHTVESLSAAGIAEAAEFIEVYEEVNHAMWAQYSAGRMEKEVLRVLRFRDTLLRFGIRDGRLADRLANAYIDLSPRKPLLMPGAAQLLGDLHGRFKLHIITNGFDEVQHVKLRCSGIEHHFDVVLTSERAGAHKPDPRIFREALRRTKASAQESLMVGDNVLADMLGARQAGWDHAHYHAETEADPLATYRVGHLDELRTILL